MAGILFQVDDLVGLKRKTVTEFHTGFDRGSGIEAVQICVALIERRNENFDLMASRWAGWTLVTFKRGPWQAINVDLACLNDIFEGIGAKRERRVDGGSFRAAYHGASRVKRKSILPQRAIGFNLDTKAPFNQRPYHRRKILPEGLAARDDYEVPVALATVPASREAGAMLDDFIRQGFRAAAGVFRIAAGTLEIAACKAKEDGATARERPFALDREESVMQLDGAISGAGKPFRGLGV